ncbi:MAG: spermidine/putrescine ABC transporter substrate-binding protein [Thermoleophilia bacterium]|nr:spermidine/putrescine ABC transporter substrate-binding protein [Thermoleophilia bacterium]
MNDSSKKKPLRIVLLALAGLVASLALAACGGDSAISTGSSNEDVPTAPGGEASGNLKISNWPLYIDRQTIGDFEEASGIKTDYVEDVNDNDEFFGKVQPLFSQGDSGGRSIAVTSDWMSNKMYDLGYIQKLDHDELKTVDENMIPSLKDPSFDPGRQFTVPWQSGMTGLVVRSDLAPDVKSVNDLFDPKYKGKVTFLREMRDTVPVIMKADGIDPADATKEDWLNTIDKINQAVESGQIRRFTGNDYIQDLAKGSVVATIGWSGDAVQAQADNKNINYVQPTEGCGLWSDNMMIPVGAPNAAAAYEFMNYVYEPENMAQIVEWVNYISPVEGVKEILLEKDPSLAKNQLIFPSDKFLENCFTVDSPPGGPEDVKEVEQAFQDVLAG